MDLEKSCPSQEDAALNISRVISQSTLQVSIKEFHRRGQKTLKVISEKGLADLINKIVELEAQKRSEFLCKQKEILEKTCKELEAQVAELRRELEGVKLGCQPDITDKVKEAVHKAVEEAREGLGDVSQEFTERLISALLRLMAERYYPRGPLPIKGLKKGEAGLLTAEKGRLFEKLLKENIQVKESFHAQKRVGEESPI